MPTPAPHINYAGFYGMSRAEAQVRAEEELKAAIRQSRRRRELLERQQRGRGSRNPQPLRQRSWSMIGVVEIAVDRLLPLRPLRLDVRSEFLRGRSAFAG